MKAKKIGAILLSAIAVVSLLAGCGAAAEDNQTETAEQTILPPRPVWEKAGNC